MTRTVVVSGARSLAALEILAAFKEAGWRTVATDAPPVTPAGSSGKTDRYTRVPGPVPDPAGFRAGVARLLGEEAPTLWVPTCEETFHLAEIRDGLGIPLLAPPIGMLASVHDKLAFAATAGALGLAPAETIPLVSRADVAGVASRASGLVLKPVWSRFGTRTLVKPDARSLSGLAPSPTDPWVAQTYLPGPEASSYCVASEGHVLAYSAYHSAFRAAGAGILFEPEPDPALRDATERLVYAMGWDGQAAFDFRKDAAGSWKAIECNPRATSGVHLVPSADLFAAMAEGRAGGLGMTGCAMVGMAMVTYGLSGALVSGRMRNWMSSFMASRGVPSLRRDPRAFAAQFGLIAHMVRRSAEGRMSVVRATTSDLEWPG